MTVAMRGGARFTWSAAAIVAALLFAAYRLAYLPSVPDYVPGGIWQTGYPQSFAEAVSRLRDDAAIEERRASSQRGDWLSLQNAAAAWLSLARLTGDPAAFRNADARLATAFTIATPGSGPHHLRASVELAVHRLDRAEAAIAATERYALPDPDALRGDAVGMKGDIALYRGDYGHALGHYKVAETLAGPIIACRTANLYAWLGRTRDALAAVDRCEAAPKMRSRGRSKMK